MAPILTEMPWLTTPPRDFKAQCQEIAAARQTAGKDIQFLASHALSALQSAALSKAIKRFHAAGGDFRPLTSFRLGVLANSTFDIMLDSLPVAAARHGVAVDISIAPYDQVIQQSIDPSSCINKTPLDGVLLAVDHRWFGFDTPKLQGAHDHVLSAVEKLAMAVDGLAGGEARAIILQTVPVWPDPLFGGADRYLKGTQRWLIEEVNRHIVRLAGERGCYLVDVAALAEKVGTDNWCDQVTWYLFKSPVSAACIGIYSDIIGRLLGSIRGMARKCLVLDLDNTLWGGAIGDDGIDGIMIGKGDAESEAFLSIQQYVLSLRERGIILAACSRNDEQTALLPFRMHPEILLKEEHFAAFQANWLDKATNIASIARFLNIGIESLVFLDDNPAERAHVRASLPMVGVPELGNEPSYYPWYLANAGYFEATTYSHEDKIRASSYSADALRGGVRLQSDRLGEYLTSLEMCVDLSPFDEVGRQRVVQLINKSNQFNLTTRRYSDAEVRAIITDRSVFARQVRLRDRFGELGIIAVVICKEVDQESCRSWFIDTWLMSCRVLGRKVEEIILRELVIEARRLGLASLIGQYIPTAKNSIVARHYDTLGFLLVGETPDGVRRYRLSLADYQGEDLPFLVSSHNSRAP